MPNHSVLPHQVVVSIDDLLSSLDSAGQPSMAARQLLHASIEQASRPLHPKAAYFRRIKWGLGCAVAVLPIWEQVAQDNQASRMVLRLALAALGGAATLEELDRANEDFFVQLLDAGNDDSSIQVASTAGFALYAAVRWVVYDFDPETLTLPAIELDPVEWEPALYASIAYARGIPWMNAGDSERRRRFWTWSTRTMLSGIWNPLVGVEEAIRLGVAPGQIPS